MIKEFLRTPVRKLVCLLTVVSLPFFLAACGGGGGGGGGSSSTDSSTDSGVITVFQAVDPYIVGAVFQELAEDGHTLLQRSSSASDAQGYFSFPRPITPGSLIELKAGSKGTHLGTAYQGMLRIKIPASGADDAVVSPLTTLEANGFTRQEVVSLLSAAGLPGLVPADFELDPFAPLEGRTSGITATDLRPLQANLAINALLESLGDLNLDPVAMNTAERRALLQGIVGATIATLNPTLFNQVAGDIGSQYGVPILIDDLIYSAVHAQGTLVGRMQEAIAANGLPLPSSLLTNAVQDCLAQTDAWVASQAEARGGVAPDPGGNPDPPGNPGTTSGQALYDSNCSSCHALGTYDNSGFLNLLGKGSLVAGKINGGHQGVSMTAAELTALAAWINSPTTDPVTDPGPGTGPGTTPSDGQAVYDGNCAVCHRLGSYDAAGGIDLDGKSHLINAKLTAGHNGINLSTADEDALIAWVDTQSGGTITPPVITDGATLYVQECQGCHQLLASTNINNRTLAAIEGAIAANLGGMGGISLTTEQVQAIVDVLPVPPAPDPGTPPIMDGATLYGQSCQSCHGALANTNINNRTLSAIEGAINANLGGMGSINLLTEQLQAIVDVLPVPPAPDPGTPPVMDGATLYTQDCQGCHGPLASTNINNRTLSAIEGAINANLGGMGGINLLTEQLQAIVDVLPVPPAPDPGTPPADGPSLYAGNCAGCHQIASYDTTGSAPDLGGKGSLIATKLGSGHMGVSLAGADTATLAAWLDTFDAVVVDPTPLNCTSCHGQPPNGVDFPNGAGAHAVHLALAGIDSCATCHDGADHNDVLDQAFPANYNAKSGAAVANANSTCSNISCHGGQTTPNWWTGQLTVNSQCGSCHTRGTTQYNSQNSGDHSRHSNYACTVCHNTATLATQHFSNLGTTSVEGTASATVGGGTTRVTSYSGSTRSCTNSCHGRETW